MRIFLAIIVVCLVLNGCNKRTEPCKNIDVVVHSKDSAHVGIINYYAYPQSVAPCTMPFF